MLTRTVHTQFPFHRAVTFQDRCPFLASCQAQRSGTLSGAISLTKTMKGPYCFSTYIICLWYQLTMTALCFLSYYLNWDIPIRTRYSSRRPTSFMWQISVIVPITAKCRTLCDQDVVRLEEENVTEWKWSKMVETAMAVLLLSPKQLCSILLFLTLLGQTFFCFITYSQK
jgi:hypothetical protein